MDSGTVIAQLDTADLHTVQLRRHGQRLVMEVWGVDGNTPITLTAHEAVTLGTILAAETA